MTITQDEAEKKLLDHMVNRFLQWPIPKDFYPDGGISFSRTVNTVDGVKSREEMGPAWWPSGTNLLHEGQARKLIEFLLEGSGLTEANAKIAELEGNHTELKSIHDVIMCVARVKEAPESDTYTLRAVKQMAMRINSLVEQAIEAEENIAEQQLQIDMMNCETVAWYEGNDAGVFGAAARWEEALTSEIPKAGVMSEPLEGLYRRTEALRIKIAELQSWLEGDAVAWRAKIPNKQFNSGFEYRFATHASTYHDCEQLPLFAHPSSDKKDAERYRQLAHMEAGMVSPNILAEYIAKPELLDRAIEIKHAAMQAKKGG